MEKKFLKMSNSVINFLDGAILMQKIIQQEVRTAYTETKSDRLSSLADIIYDDIKDKEKYKMVFIQAVLDLMKEDND